MRKPNHWHKQTQLGRERTGATLKQLVQSPCSHPLCTPASYNGQLTCPQPHNSRLHHPDLYREQHSCHPSNRQIQVSWDMESLQASKWEKMESHSPWVHRKSTSISMFWDMQTAYNSSTGWKYTSHMFKGLVPQDGGHTQGSVLTFKCVHIFYQQPAGSLGKKWKSKLFY